MGIGVNTGEAVVGNIGSEQRAKYAIVGSAVNIAARVEGATVGGQVFVTAATWAQIRDLAEVNAPVDVEVKGLSEPLRLYELRGIGGRYAQRAPAAEPDATAQAKVSLALRCWVIEGKIVAHESVGGRVLRIGRRELVARLDAPMPPLTNVRLRLAYPNTPAESADIYGKVVGARRAGWSDAHPHSLHLDHGSGRPGDRRADRGQALTFPRRGLETEDAPMTDKSPVRILILGGGFGGVYTAMALEKKLARELDEGRVELALISRDNYIVFQPMLPEVISGSIGLLDTITPIRRLCPRTNLYTRSIEGIDLGRRRVTAAAGFGSQPLELEYDHLVIALGSVTSFAGAPGLAEHALPFKYLGDALVLRNHAIHVLEEADIQRDPEARRSLLTFVVAGGGFSGVEAVAELNDFVRAAARSFRNIRPEEIAVALLHAGDLILPELPPSLASFAQRLLAKRGVQIRLNTRLAGATGDAALLAGGERIPTRTLVSTVPSGPNPLVAMLPCRKDRGRVVTDPHLELPEYPGVWAVGDCALILDGRTGQPSPPTAQHATREAACVADNIAASLSGKPRRAFAFKALGKMGSLGHRSAVAEIFGLRLSGFLAWWLWRTIYLMKLPGLDRKIRVAVDWTLDLLLPPDIVQLRTERSFGIRREHFEAGEVICEEGGHGDWLYIIADGQVDVVKRVPGRGEVALRRLGPGDCFGEIAILGDHVRTATARSATAVNVLAVDRDAFHALFSTLPPLRRFFEGLIAERMMSAAGPDASPTRRPEPHASVV